MTHKTFYSLDKLVAYGRKSADNFNTISFDLFDTLLIRRIHDSDLVKLPVARYISELAKRKGIGKSWQAVQKLRDRVEQNQRYETGKRFDDQEASYPVFMEETLKVVFGSQYDQLILEDVTGYELEMESRMLVPRKLLVEWLNELNEQSKRVLIISDIYLPSEHLKILVKNTGLSDLVEDVVSSADTFLAKASGHAFPLVQKQFDIDKKNWLHVGDNPISDGLRPAEFGISTLIIKDSEERYRKALIKRYYNYSKGRPFYRGRALQQLMLPLEAENIEHPKLYVEGYNFIGPLIGAFVQHIAEECRRLGITIIFFFSREGYTFKKVWERCIPVLFPDGDLPDIEYLYVSRMALASAACAYQGLTITNVSIALLPPGNKDLKDIARIYQLDLKELQPFLAQHKLTPESCLSQLHEGYDQKNSVRLMELLENEDFQDQIKKQAIQSNIALQKYLTDLQFFNHNQIATVDIGWLGTIQRFLYDAVKHRTDCPRFHGYVFGATRGISFQNDLKNSIEGVVYDRYQFDLAASSILYAQDLFEEACRASHPTLEKYELTEEGYNLKFRTDKDDIGQAELEQDEYFGPMQKGILDAAEAFGSASALMGYSVENYRSWLNYVMAAKLAFPKTSEILELRHKYHLDDFHGANSPLKKAVADKRLWDYGSLALRLLPFLRLRLFWKHTKNTVNS